MAYTIQEKENRARIRREIRYLSEILEKYNINQGSDHHEYAKNIHEIALLQVKTYYLEYFGSQVKIIADTLLEDIKSKEIPQDEIIKKIEIIKMCQSMFKD